MTFWNPEAKCIRSRIRKAYTLKVDSRKQRKAQSKTTWSFGTVGRANVQSESIWLRPHGLSEESERKSAIGKEMLKTSFGITGNDIRRLPLSEPPETMIEYYKKTLTL